MKRFFAQLAMRKNSQPGVANAKKWVKEEEEYIYLFSAM
jgi:hypothetical protein